MKPKGLQRLGVIAGFLAVTAWASVGDQGCAPSDAVLSGVLLSASSVGAQKRVLDFSALEKVALKELKETNTPGAAVAVVSGDRLVFAKGLGTANIETGASVTPDMLFRIGSVTEMFTAAVLVTLGEDEQINLNEQGHSLSGNAKPAVIRPFGDNVAGWPDGFLFSSVYDLARFTIAFMNGGTIDGKASIRNALMS